MNKTTLIIRDRLQLKAIINRLFNHQSLIFDGNSYTKQETATAIAEFLTRQKLLPTEISNKSIPEISDLISQEEHFELLTSIDQFIDQGFKQETASLPQNLQELVDAKIQFDSLEQTQDNNISLGKLSVKQLIEIAQKNQKTNAKWQQKTKELATELLPKEADTALQNQTLQAAELVNEIIAEQTLTKKVQPSVQEIRETILYNPQISKLGLKGLAKIDTYTKNILADTNKISDLKKTYLSNRTTKSILNPNLKQIIDLFEIKGNLTREAATNAANNYLKKVQYGKEDPFVAVISAVEEVSPGKGLSLANYLSHKPIFLKAIQNYQDNQIIYSPQGIIVPENIVITTTQGSKSIGQITRIINRSQRYNEISTTDLIEFLGNQNPIDIAQQLGIATDSQEFKSLQLRFQKTNKTITDGIAQNPEIATYLPSELRLPFSRIPQHILFPQGNHQINKNEIKINYKTFKHNPQKNIFGENHWLNNRLTARPTAWLISTANNWAMQSSENGRWSTGFKSFIGKRILGIGKKLGLNANGLNSNIENIANKYLGKTVNTAVTAAVASTGVGAPLAKAAGWISEKVVQKVVPFVKKYGKYIIGAGLAGLWSLLGNLMGVAANMLWAGAYAIPGFIMGGIPGAIAGGLLGYTTGSTTWKFLTDKIPSLKNVSNWVGNTTSNIINGGNSSITTVATQSIGAAVGITAVTSIFYLQYLNSIFALPPFEKGDYHGISGDKIICKSPESYPVNGWPIKGEISQMPDTDYTHTEKVINSIDIKASYGTPVKSTQNGKVLVFFQENETGSDGYGNLVIIEGNGITTYYGHLKRSFVKTGETVKIGEIIGEVDSTGHSDGNHLHYEIRDKNRNVNREQVPIECTMGIKP